MTSPCLIKSFMATLVLDFAETRSLIMCLNSFALDPSFLEKLASCTLHTFLCIRGGIVDSSWRDHITSVVFHPQVMY